MATHENSKIIQIHRSKNFSVKVDEGAAASLEECVSMIGSYRVGLNMGSGLEAWEIDELLPRIILLKATDMTFRKEVDKYYAELRHNIPITKYNKHNNIVSGGISLEIGKKVDNNKPIRFKDKDGNIVINDPLNIEDYVKAHHIMRHPKVANDKDEALRSPNKVWFIFDPKRDVNINLRKADIKDEAMTLYIKNKIKPDVVRFVCTVMSNLGRTLRELDDADLLIEFRKLAEKEPEKFIETIKDKDLEFKFLLGQALSYGVLLRVGDKIIDANSEVEYGNNLFEACKHFQDKANSLDLKRLKNNLKVAIGQ